MDEITFGEYLVTCQTQGCGNAEASIQISAPIPEEAETIPVVICGVCSQTIEDITAL